MSARGVLHRVRDLAVRLAAERAFEPIERPEKRLVLVRPDHFGDMLMLAPAVNALRQHVSDHEIILMTGPWNRDVAGHIMAVDRIITMDFPGFARDGETASLHEPYRLLGQAAGSVRQLRPQAITLLRDDHWWGAWMAREAGVPLRFGYANHRLEPFLTHPVNVSDAHYVQQNYHLLSTTLRLLGYTGIQGEGQTLASSWPVDPGAAEIAGSLLEGHGVHGNYLVIHPGTGAAVKRWPVDRWGATVDALASQIGIPLVLTGSSDDWPLCQAIVDRASAPIANLAGKTTLFALAEILRGASLVLGVDSGPLHLASAVGAPSIHLYGPSDPVRYGPWGDPKRHRAIDAGMRCPACGDISPDRPEGCGCMLAITPSTVVSTAMEMLDHGS